MSTNDREAERTPLTAPKKDERLAENPPAPPADGLIPEDTTPAGTDRSPD